MSVRKRSGGSAETPALVGVGAARHQLAPQAASSSRSVASCGDSRLSDSMFLEVEDDGMAR